MKVSLIVGTRPEIIKMAPVIRECQNRQIPYFIIHSNQHYSEEMDSIFFKELELPKPHYNLGVGSGLHSNQTGNILIKMEPILIDEKPDVVLVQGDTNTVLAGALAASKLGIKVGHIEAGLRSYDRTMPEETNRIMTDHISDYLFAVGPNQTRILLNEGVEQEKIHQVGNTVSDSLFQNLEISAKTSTVMDDLGLTSKGYILVTAHRASNVDHPNNLRELLALFNAMHQRFSQTIVWPIHPRTQAKLKEHDISVPDYLTLLRPIGYMDFIQLQKHAQLILTDSGGIQEEACLLGVPCITLRENTERPESVEVGANVLVGRHAKKAVEAANNWLSVDDFSWRNPFGDGHVAEAILDTVLGVVKDTEIHEKIVANGSAMSVIGMGYMGLPIACLIAEAGYRVTGVDLDPGKVAAINSANCPFDEVGLPELLKKVVKQEFLQASTQIASSEIYLVAVPTPHKEGKCEDSFIMKAVDSIAKVAQDGQVVILESTIAPQTSLRVQQQFNDLGLNLYVVHCPERAIPGQTLHELVHNDRIIGANNKEAQLKVKGLYQSFIKGNVFLTDLTTAECVKLVENTSRDVGIAFANELAQICEELEVNVYDVIKLANRHPRVNVLTPGPGVGGHCIPIDPWFLVEGTQTGDLVRLSRKINDERPHIVASKIVEALKEKGGNKVCLLGVAYKANVDDCRETPASAILQTLQNNGIEVFYHDPYVESWDCQRLDSMSQVEERTDLAVIVTDHTCYENLALRIPVFNTRG